MKISDFACPSCAASYEVAESMSAKGSPGRAECTICGRLLEAWQEPKMKAYRLVLSPEHKYPHITIDRTMILLAFVFAAAWSVTGAMAANNRVRAATLWKDRKNLLR